ncbi:MAG: hypothetical protein M3O67_06870, partial [Bacteroidota bacterium]|nr:hypothetical protein [Bacteroidota bacterium]
DNQAYIFLISSLVENFVVLANDIDRIIADVRDKSNMPGNDEYYTYINKAINLVEYGFKVAHIIHPGVADDRYIIMAKNANNLYKNIFTKNYNNAVMNVYNILDQVFTNSKNLANEKINRLKAEGVSTTDIEKKFETATRVENLPNTKVIGAILKYGNFMASVVKAGSANEVQNAIEAAALPAGSYSIKQRSALNISVNGYIGYAFAYNGGLYAHGVYAPVGICLSRGLNKKYAGAISFFVSFIDVGSIASYRITNSPTEELKQEVRLESILSPSAQFILGLPKLPLAVCAGWRLTPKLFYSNQQGFTTIKPQNVFNLAILVDIPIFNIHNKPYD